LREPDDPGREETVWGERLSPCHGVVRSPLLQNEYGDERVAVFPHLTTLVRPGYRIWRVRGHEEPS
jgi:hypothetical protein